MKPSATMFGLLATAGLAFGASLQQVSNFGNNPSSIQMYIYVPDKVAANPAVIVAVRMLSPICCCRVRHLGLLLTCIT